MAIRTRWDDDGCGIIEEVGEPSRAERTIDELIDDAYRVPPGPPPVAVGLGLAGGLVTLNSSDPRSVPAFINPPPKDLRQIASRLINILLLGHHWPMDRNCWSSISSEE
jgi:hypothetical protein